MTAVPTLPPLSDVAVHHAIDKACATTRRNIKWKRTSSEDAGTTIAPLYRIETDDDDNEASATFYIAYSTWDGRFLYIDNIQCNNNNNNNNNEEATSTILMVYRKLAEIAVLLHCCRMTWRHPKERTINFPGRTQPETLEGIVTLHWDRDAAAKFLGGDKDSNANDTTNDSVRQKIEASLQGLDPHNSFRLRLANDSDLDAIGRLVQGLADCAKEPDAVNLTPDQYRIDGFDIQQRPLFYCIVLDHCCCENDCNTYTTCGMAFCYLGHELGNGSFLYLEDLFIEESYRGKGAGTLIMKGLSSISLSLGCSLLVWQALDWNSPGLRFYNRLGAKVVEGLLTTRFAGQALVDFNKENAND